MDRMLRLLIVEDNAADRARLEGLLADSSLGPCELCHSDRSADALQAMRKAPSDVVLLSIDLPDSEGVECIARFHSQSPDVPILALTARDDEGIAAAALRKGAQDCLMKGQINGSLLTRAVRYALERKKAEERLRRESLFRNTVITNAAEGLCVCREKPEYPFWVFTVWNYRMTEITGCTMDEINHLGWQRLTRPDAQVRARMAELVARMRQGEDSRGQEWTVFRPDGQERTVLISVSPLVSNSPERQVLVIAQDITERKRAERELREMLARTERVNRLMEGREIRVVELKRRVNELALAAGQTPPYASLADNDSEPKAGDPTAGASLTPVADGQPGHYRIEDLLDQDRMLRLLDSYCDIVGISSAIVDPEGKVFVGARWQRLCTEFHRVNNQTCARCIESDTVLAGQLREGERFSLYRCRNGLTDAASPIIIEGRHVANVFVGQFLLEPASEEFFRGQAKEFSFEETAYLDALSRVPVVSKEKLPAILSYLTTCARLLAEMGLERIRARASQAGLLRQAEELNRANLVVRAQREAALSLAEDANEARAATERVQQSLRESEEKYRRLVDNSLVGIGISQADHIVYANQSLLRMYGYDDFQDYASKPLVDHLTPSSRAFIEDWRERRERGEDVPYVFEHDIVRKDGAIRRLQLSVSQFTMGDTVCMQTAFIDVTERRELEKRVQNQLQFLQILMDAMPNPVYYKDRHLRYLGCNRAFEKLFGATKDQIAGKMIQDIAPKYFAEACHAADLELLAHPGVQTYEGSLASAGDVRHDVLFRKAIFRDSEGGLGGIVGVVFDTTELARVEKALLIKDSALNSAASGIILTDLEGRLTYANPSCLKMWGFDDEREIVGKPFLALLRSQEDGAAACQSTLDMGAWRGVLTARRKDDADFVVQVSASVVKDKQGKPVCLMASLVDVTEGWRLNDILDRKQKNLEAIFDAAPLGMLLVNEQRRVVRANDTIRQISGKEYREILNRYPCEALACAHGIAEFPSADRCAGCETCPLAKLVEEAFESGSPIHGAETRLVMNRDGKEIQPWFSISLEPVNIDGDKHVLIALHDVTGRKEADEQLRETMEMKSQFISTVSHEVRTPLTAMKEAIIIVADGIAGTLNKDQAQFIDIARRNIDRLARLIDEVLDFQKLSLGKMKFHMQSSHIDRTIDEAYTTMLPQAQQKQVHLSVDVEANLPSIVYDHDRMIQVLTNLLSNAIKFTPEGGRICISARRRGEDLAVSVSDTGMGIPKEALPKIFTQFFRVHRPGKEIKGTGLGLAIVSRIVTDHGGRIDVESELDKGTTFSILLPLAPKASSEGASMSPQADGRLENTLGRGTQA